jgi:hypothetical protein
MTRPLNKEANEKEKGIKDAIEGVQSGKYRSVQAAAKAFNVLHATVSHRMKGCKTCVQSHED